MDNIPTVHHTLRKFVKEVEAKPLSIKDVVEQSKDAVGVLYSEIKNFYSLEALFQGKNNLIILLDPPSTSIGHFVCLIKQPNQYVFYDPYGNRLTTLLELLNISDTSLIDLLEKEKVEVSINNHPFEKISGKINTCGRWCCLRTKWADKNNVEFQQMVKFGNITSDNLCVLLTIILFD